MICADTDEEAQRLAASGRMTFTLLRRGELIAVPPPEKALEFLADDEPRDRAPSRRAASGAPSSARPTPCAPSSRRSPRNTAPTR